MRLATFSRSSSSSSSSSLHFYRLLPFRIPFTHNIFKNVPLFNINSNGQGRGGHNKTNNNNNGDDNKRGKTFAVTSILATAMSWNYKDDDSCTTCAEKKKKTDELNRLEKIPLSAMSGNDLWSFFCIMIGIKNEELKTKYHSDLIKFLICVRNFGDTKNSDEVRQQSKRIFQSAMTDWSNDTFVARAKYLNQHLDWIGLLNIENVPQFVDLCKLAEIFVDQLYKGATNEQLREEMKKARKIQKTQKK